jgi:hypothetical protein
MEATNEFLTFGRLSDALRMWARSVDSRRGLPRVSHSTCETTAPFTFRSVKALADFAAQMTPVVSLTGDLSVT